MKKRVMFFLTVFSIFFINLFLVSAGFTLGNKSSSIETSYSPNEKIAGWINISLNKEPGNSVINTNFGGSTSLIDFLEYNGAEYSCMPSGCENDYSLSNGQSRKDFSLNFSQKRVFAINLTGVVFSVSDFSFKFNISNSPSCVSPVEVGLFDDETKWKSW